MTPEQIEKSKQIFWERNGNCKRFQPGYVTPPIKPKRLVKDVNEGNVNCPWGVRGDYLFRPILNGYTKPSIYLKRLGIG
jgi:hypothetical protein